MGRGGEMHVLSFPEFHGSWRKMGEDILDSPREPYPSLHLALTLLDLGQSVPLPPWLLAQGSLDNGRFH